jgi:hypothetical protein
MLCCTLICTANTAYMPSPSADYKMHCLYLYKFSQLVKWPAPAPNNEFTIGVVGNSPIVPALEQYIAAKNQSATVTYKVRRFSSAQAIGPCQILYVVKDQLPNFDNIMKALAGKPTLLVTEVPGLIKKGSCVNLIYEEGASIKIQINKSAIEAHNLKMMPQLLSLATEVM